MKPDKLWCARRSKRFSSNDTAMIQIDLINSSTEHSRGKVKAFQMAAPTDQASSIAKRAEAAADRFGLGTSVGTDAAGSLRLEDDEESVATSCDAVEFVLGDALNAGLGTLQITTRQVSAGLAAWVVMFKPILLRVLACSRSP
jgi:hypothetical protein